MIRTILLFAILALSASAFPQEKKEDPASVGVSPSTMPERIVSPADLAKIANRTGNGRTLYDNVRSRIKTGPVEGDSVRVFVTFFGTSMLCSETYAGVFKVTGEGGAYPYHGEIPLDRTADEKKSGCGGKIIWDMALEGDTLISSKGTRITLD